MLGCPAVVQGGDSDAVVLVLATFLLALAASILLALAASTSIPSVGMVPGVAIVSAELGARMVERG